MMYQYGTRSRQRLASCHPWLVHVCERALEYQVIDITVICGHRTEVAQNEAYATGMSKVRWPDSAHNRLPSAAVDLAPYPIDWSDTLAFARLAGLVGAAAAEMGGAFTLRWGGDWDRDGESRDQTFMDLGHFEIPELL